MANTMDTVSSTTPCCNAKRIHHLEVHADTKKGTIEYCLCHHVHTLSGHVSVTLNSDGTLVGVSRACMHVVVDVALQWCSQCFIVMYVG